MKTLILQTLARVIKHFGTSANHRPLLCRSGLVPLVLACFALCQQVQSAQDTPDPGPLPATNTADGQGALQSVTTGIYNSAFGIYSLISLTDGNFCTGVGAGTLLANTATENTAMGAGALLSNTVGDQNTGSGAFALFNNAEGIRNTAIGHHALLNNTDDSNTAVGAEALGANTTGSFNVAIGGSALLDSSAGDSNTAVGVGALSGNTTGDGNTVLGRVAGSGITTGNNITVIGQLSGVSSAFGQVDDSCYIDNVFGATVDAATVVIVGVDADGKLGTTAADAAGNKVPLANLLGGQQQTMLNRKVEKLQSRVAQQEQQIELLTSQLKEQAVQLQKVSAQIALDKTAARTVLNDQ